MAGDLDSLLDDAYEGEPEAAPPISDEPLEDIADPWNKPKRQEAQPSELDDLLDDYYTNPVGTIEERRGADISGEIDDEIDQNIIPETDSLHAAGAAWRGASAYAYPTAAGFAVGNVPGAIAGFGTAMTADVLNMMGVPIASSKDISDQINNMLEVPKARTPVENIIETGAYGLSGAVTPVGASRATLTQIGQIIGNPQTRILLEQVASEPYLRAALSGSVGAGTGQAIVEFDPNANPATVLLFSLAAGQAATMRPQLTGEKTAIVPKHVSAAAREGYVVPWTGKGKSKMRKAVDYWADRKRSNEIASLRNQVVVNQKASGALNIQKNLTPQKITKQRESAIPAYGAMARNVKTVALDEDYVEGIFKSKQKLAEKFEDLDVDQVFSQLPDSSIDPTEAIGMVSEFRSQAVAAFKGGDTQLGIAYREAANALDSAIIRNVTKTNKVNGKRFEALSDFVKRSFDVEAALDKNGNVDVSLLSEMALDVKSIDPVLRPAVKAYRAAPGAMQNASNIKYYPFSGQDMAALFTISDVVLAKPIVRRALLNADFKQAKANPMKSNREMRIDPSIPGLYGSGVGQENSQHRRMQ